MAMVLMLVCGAAVGALIGAGWGVLVRGLGFDLTVGASTLTFALVGALLTPFYDRMKRDAQRHDADQPKGTVSKWPLGQHPQQRPLVWRQAATVHSAKKRLRALVGA
jgi:hypothetical protein